MVSSATTGNVWYLDGQIIIPNETDQNLILTQFSQTGNYTVIVSENGCTSEMSDSVSVQNKSTGVGEMDNVTFFNVYPNPNDGNFNVSFEVPEKGTYTLELKNLLGQAVYQITLNNFNGVYTNQLSVSSYGKGILYPYFNWI